MCSSTPSDVLEGCNEIIFNPFIKWWKMGPISPQLRGFVWSKAPLHYKVGMMSCKCAAFSFPCKCSLLRIRYVFIL